MKLLKQNIEYIIFLSIQTVPQFKKFEDMPQDIQFIWEDKSKYYQDSVQKEPGELFYKTAMIPELGKIIMISMAMIDLEKKLQVKHFYSDNERRLLFQFSEEIRKIKYKRYIIITYDGFKRDYQFISKRMLINHVRIPEVFNIFGLNTWNYPERLTDIFHWWKSGGFGYVEFPMIAHNFKVDYKDLDYQQIFELYYKDLSEYVSMEHQDAFKEIKKMNEGYLKSLIRLVIKIRRDKIEL